MKARAQELVEFFGLQAVAGHPAAGLPFGTLKRVELARALAAEPRLLLDEPAAGLNHGEVAALARLITLIRTQHAVTLLLMEHHTRTARVGPRAGMPSDERGTGGRRCRRSAALVTVSSAVHHPREERPPAGRLPGRGPPGTLERARGGVDGGNGARVQGVRDAG